jgi:multiple sugar transport system permease protein
LLHGYFETIPRELDDAARVDGCSWLGAAVRVVFPAAAPGLASLAIILAVVSWGQFTIPYVLLSDRDLFPVSVGVINLHDTTGPQTLQYVAAGAVLGILPVAAVFIVLQRFILDGLTQGALKA